MPHGFPEFIAAAIVLVLSHAVPSAPSVRPGLISRLGKPGFFVLYSLVSMAALAAFLWAYARSDLGPTLYPPLAGGSWVAVALMPLAVVLVVGRLTTPYGTPEAPRSPHGIYRICRFPGCTGLFIWVFLHLINLGDSRRVLFFLTMGVITLAALIKNQRLRHRSEKEGQLLASLPTGSAIAAARRRFVWREFGWWRLGLSLVVYFVLLLGHPFVIGADPLAGALVRD